MSDGEIDEESLDTYLDVMDDAAPEITARPRTTPAYPALHPTGATWADAMTAMREREAETGETKKVPPPTIDILENVLEPDRAGLGGGLKTALATVTAAAWPDIRLQRTVVAVGDELYAADAKLAPGEEVPKHRRGDLKTPAHVDTHWYLLATHKELGIGFRAHWMEGVTPKGARSFKWKEVRIADPLGMPTEFFANYEPSADDLKQAKEEPGWAHEQRSARIRANAERMDQQYNDGASWLNRRPLIKGATLFTTWLSEAVKITESASLTTT